MVAAIDEELRSLDKERLAVEERLAAIEAAEGSLPSTDAVTAARQELGHAVAVAVAAERVAIAEGDRATAVDRRKEAALSAEALRAEGVRLGLPTDPAGLDEVTSAVRDYEKSTAELQRIVESAEHLRSQALDASARLDRFEEALSRRRHEHATVSQHAERLAERVAEMRRQLGPDAEAPLRRRREIEGEVDDLKARVEETTVATFERKEDVGAARSHADSAREAVEHADGLVKERREPVAVLARSEVWEAVAARTDGREDVDADITGSTPPTDPVELCRFVARATSDIDTGPEAVRAATNQLDLAYRVLMDGLRHGFEPSQIHDDDVGIVQVTSETGTMSVLQLARELAAQVAQHEELLDERDREIFERHLLTRVSETLRDLLNNAHELVVDINACLRGTPTASGLRVRLRWQLDQGSTAQQDAMDLLRKSPELLGPDDRERLRRFFAGAIAEERAANPGAGYEAVLTRVFDYRTWHSFVPFLVLATGGSRQLTRSVFRSLSGGEQSVSLHLPLFAAAAAHYNAAEGGAPRLIALDEAFAGIDEGMRADLMGLLVRFDLDVIMTGHELWGAYEQVPGVMIYDLLRRPPAEGVSSMPMRWDGGSLVEEAMPTRGGPGSGHGSGVVVVSILW